MSFVKFLAIVPTTLTLAACSGGSGSGGGSGDSPDSFADYADQGEILADTVFDIPFTDPATLPTSGSATYDGFLGVIVSDGTVAAGKMELEASFSSNEVSGAVSDVRDEDENAYSGELDIRNGTIDRTADTSFEFTFEADLIGALDGPEGQLLVDADMQGDFTGPNHDYVEGTVDGEVVSPNGLFAIVDGSFVGQR